MQRLSNLSRLELFIKNSTAAFSYEGNYSGFTLDNGAIQLAYRMTGFVGRGEVTLKLLTEPKVFMEAIVMTSSQSLIFNPPYYLCLTTPDDIILAETEIENSIKREDIGDDHTYDFIKSLQEYRDQCRSEQKTFIAPEPLYFETGQQLMKQTADKAALLDHYRTWTSHYRQPKSLLKKILDYFD